MKILPLLCTALLAFSFPARGDDTNVENAFSPTANYPNVNGDNVTVDAGNLNIGTSSHRLFFGLGSGEGIGSKRNAGPGQYGLDFYTGYQQRMTLDNNGALSLTPTTGGNLTGRGLAITQSSSSGGPPPSNWAFNDIQVTDSTHYGLGHFQTALNIGHNFGGGSTTGNRIGVQVQLSLNGPTLNTGDPFLNNNYVAGYFGSYANTADGGTFVAPRGSVFGAHIVPSLRLGATNFAQLAGIEIDIEARTGSSVQAKHGIIINYSPSDAVGASLADNMIALVSGPLIDAGGTIPGAKVGIEFGYANGTGEGAPVRYDGTLIKTTGPSVVAAGIDFSSYDITNHILKGKYSSLTEKSLNLGDDAGFAVIGARDANSPDVTILLRPKGKGTITTQGISVAEGGFRPPHIPDSQAANDTIYFSTNSNKLVYKDPSGMARPLN